VNTAELKGRAYSAESEDAAKQAWQLRQDIAVLADLTLARELLDPVLCEYSA
jgi:hypothetical protein